MDNNLKVYVRGNISFPNGVLNRLILLGGKVENNEFSEAELSNPSNIFYIDFYDDNIIRKIVEDSINGKMMVDYWKEIQPYTYIDEPENLPDSWNSAYEKCIEVKNYMQGKNVELDNKLNNLGKCIVLRDIYRQGWEQKGNKFCYYIEYNLYNDELEIIKGIKTNKLLSFQEIELAEMFLKNFKDLIIECKYLI